MRTSGESDLALVILAANAKIRAEFAQGDLGVIARRHRLRYGGPAVGEESAEQDACLHLCAGHGQGVVDGPQPGAVDFERREFPFPRVDLRTPFGPWPADAP